MKASGMRRRYRKKMTHVTDSIDHASRTSLARDFSKGTASLPRDITKTDSSITKRDVIMSSKFKQVGADRWVHEDIASVVFPKKPPDWIADYLVEISASAYAMGEGHARFALRQALSDIGMATLDDLPDQNCFEK